jgi:hypothetical protein
VLVVCRTQSGFVGRAVAVGLLQARGRRSNSGCAPLFYHFAARFDLRLVDEMTRKGMMEGSNRVAASGGGRTRRGLQMLIFVSGPVVAGTYTFIKDWYDFSDCTAGCVGGIDVPAVEARRAASPLGVLFANLRACAMCRLVPLCHSLAGRHFPVDICC